MSQTQQPEPQSPEPDAAGLAEFFDALQLLEGLAGEAVALDALPAPQRPATGALTAAAAPSEGQLRRAEARYRSLVEQIPAITFMAALDGGLNELYVSPQVESMLGFSQREWLANPVLWHSQLHPGDRDRWSREFAVTCATGRPFRSEYRFIARDGRTVWVHGEAQVVRDESGRPLFLQGVAFDITESKRAEEQMRSLNEELERRVALRTDELQRANKDLEAFSYSVSHDLRAPLRTIYGFSQALEEDCGAELSAEGQGHLRRVLDAAARMEQLIEGMLKLSRVSRADLRRERVDLSAIATQVAAELRAHDPARKVEFQIAPGAEAVGDVPLVRQVLQNLLGNAWKYTARRDLAKIEFGSAELDGQKVYFVRDNGAGFDMAYAGKLFGAFQRLHTESEFAGTGIGLATVQRIVARLGGRVWVEAAVDRGATFFFTL